MPKDGRVTVSLRRSMAAGAEFEPSIGVSKA
jgi:hypothetical protein